MGEGGEEVTHFMLFAGDEYESAGGWNEYQGTFVRIEAAVSMFDANTEGRSWDWGQIVSIDTTGDDLPTLVLEYGKGSHDYTEGKNARWLRPDEEPVKISRKALAFLDSLVGKEIHIPQIASLTSYANRRKEEDAHD